MNISIFIKGGKALNKNKGDLACGPDLNGVSLEDRLVPTYITNLFSYIEEKNFRVLCPTYFPSNTIDSTLTFGNLY